MNITTLLRYLIGDRAAILQIARSRSVLVVGLLFVLSAGFAREYDKEDLLHEPWYVAIPAAASLASSFALFTVAYTIAACRGAGWPPFFRCYLAFLGLFWLAAPMAWLYAVPYEHFLSPANAMRVNLLTLGVVSLWRVALMVRVLMVLLGYGLGAALCLVALFADVLALSLLNFLPFPLIDFMGGIQLSERNRVLRDVALAVCQVGVCSFPIWFVGSIAAAFASRPTWNADDETPGPRPSATLFALAIGSVLIWIPILPSTQPPQLRRGVVERAFAQGDIDGALREMSRYDRSDFPPGWEPPPVHVNQYAGPRGDPQLTSILERLASVETAEWVREAYLDKAAEMLGGWVLHDEKSVHSLAGLIHRIPDGPAMLDRMKDQRLASKLRDALHGMERQGK